MITSASLIGYGWADRNVKISIIGAIIYLVVVVVGIITVFIESKEFLDGNFKESNSGKDFFKIISSLVEGSIAISGLIAMLFENSIFKTQGIIIWVGTIAIYFICGIIISSVTNLPLKMTYGGWRIGYNKKSNR